MKQFALTELVHEHEVCIESPTFQQLLKIAIRTNTGLTYAIGHG